eukprot:3917504-Prymnesium_polylepis.1
MLGHRLNLCVGRLAHIGNWALYDTTAKTRKHLPPGGAIKHSMTRRASLGARCGPPSDVFTNALITDAETQP